MATKRTACRNLLMKKWEQDQCWTVRRHDDNGGSRDEALEVDLNEAGDVDVRVDILLHKISDLVTGDEPFESMPAVKRLEALRANNPRLCLVDSLDSVAKVLNRAELSALLQRVECLTESGPILRAPRTIQVAENSTARSVQQAAELCGMRLPCIWKSAAACGIAEAHHMAVIFDWEGLSQMARNRIAILQEFVNHDGLLHKVYVIGKKVHVVQKPSIGNLTSGTQPSMVPFDSLSGVPPLGEPAAQTSACSAVCRGTADGVSHQTGCTAVGSRVLSREVVATAVERLRACLGLTLFGFDVIVDCNGDHFVIDVNYFPSFKEVPDAPEHLWEALHDAVSGKKV